MTSARYVAQVTPDRYPKGINMHATETRKSRRLCGARHGAVVVEFAVTAPVLFLTFFGMVEFGRFNLIRHGIDTAAYEGARCGIVPGATSDDVRAKAEEILHAVSAVETTVTVEPSTITPQTEQVTVSVEVSLSHNGWVIPKFFQQATLSRSCTIAREQLDTF